MYVLFTDTDCDMDLVTAKKYDYHLISMPYTVGDKEIHPYEDFEKFSCHEFYEMLRKGVMPTTSGLSPETYINYFEPIFKEGKDILYVHFSKNMSGTFAAMNLALEELKEKYPERKVYTIDTKAITLLSFNVALEIGEMYIQGKSVEEIMKWAETEVDKFAMYFFVEDLKFFKRSGRVKSFSAFMGNLLGIRPIIYMDKDGNMTSIDKAIGRKTAISKIFNYIETLQDDIKNHRVLIGHTDMPELANQIGEKLKEKFGQDLNVQYVEINPTAGSHCGPNGVGICFHAIHR